MLYRRDFSLFKGRPWWSLNDFRAKNGCDCSISRWKVPDPNASRWALFKTRKRITAPRLPLPRFICPAVDYSCSCDDEKSKEDLVFPRIRPLKAERTFLWGEPEVTTVKTSCQSVYRVTTSTFSYEDKTVDVVKARVSCRQDTK